MQLTMLDGGKTFLSRQQQNRARMIVSHVALGGAGGYTFQTSASAFRSAILYKSSIDAMQVSGDTAVFTCFLPADMSLTFGEIAILSSEGGFLGMVVLPNKLVKNPGSQMQLTLELTYSGLGDQLTFSTNSVVLSKVRPDFNDILLQLQSVASEKDSWSGLVTNETGTTLLELMAGIGEFDAYMFESALQEAFSDTAKLNSSQYAIQNMLGNRLTRKSPAGCDATFTREGAGGSQVIPAYTQWVVNGVNYFNREAISFAAGQYTKDGRIYQGQVIVNTVQGLGVDYPFWISIDGDFAVADADVTVYLNQTAIPVVQDPLWNYLGTPAVQDRTNKDGKLHLIFGNATMATRPEITDTVTIRYVVTLGNSGNNASFTGSKMTSNLSGFTAVATTALTGGGDEPSVTLYQRMGGDLYGGQRGAVTPAQYRARAREYPGVLDAVVLAQRDLAPYDKNWFNTGKIILLTQQPWTQADRDAYELWYRKRTMYSMRYQVLTGEAGTEPRKKTLSVRATISCRNDADLVDIQTKAEGAVKKLFVPRAGILSRDLYMTDITDAIKDVAPELIDFVQLALPTDDVIMDITSPKNLTVDIQTGAGTLPPGSYTYGVSAIDGDGTTSPTVIKVVTTAPMSKLTFSWDPVAAATGYIIYGRTEPFTKIGQTVAPTFVEDGTAAGTGEPASTLNTSGVHYVALGTLDLSVKYSKRRQIEDSGFSQ